MSVGSAWAPLLVIVGMGLWTLGEYTLHRFAMHELRGRGLMSREHLEHHVKASWSFDPMLVFAWLGVIIVGVGGWGTLGLVLSGRVAGGSLAVGWIGGYAIYEYVHARAHLVGPTSILGRRLRQHHFHHHFGHPMSNHGVSLPFWDRVFGTLDRPEVVQVPRRLAQPWMLGEDGELTPEHARDYVLVGTATRDERLARARPRSGLRLPRSDRLTPACVLPARSFNARTTGCGGRSGGGRS